jgi:hypothetical protein
MRDRPVILGALALLLVILSAPFWRGALAQTHGASPVIPAAKGAHCVRPVAWMRKNHMKLLMRLRYEAVHEGIRHKEESLPGCMNCHVSRLADGKYPSVTSRKFFCNACHDYVGVRIDCFSCHSNRPDVPYQAAEAMSRTLPVAREGRAATVVTARAARASSALSQGQERRWSSPLWRSQ